VPGAYDSAPNWSPDGRRIAFESNADVGGANPERDMEIWVMRADGSRPVQLTANAAHDEGPSWSPDGRRLTYTSGPDATHGDIHVMTSAGRDVRRLTRYAGADESPDWQAIAAPQTDARNVAQGHCPPSYGSASPTSACTHRGEAAGGRPEDQRRATRARRTRPTVRPASPPRARPRRSGAAARRCRTPS